MPKSTASIFVNIFRSDRFQTFSRSILILSALILILRFTQPIQASYPENTQADPVDVSIALSASPDPAIQSEPTEIFVKVVAVDNSMIPVGVVELKSDHDDICLITLDLAGEGSCTFTYSSKGFVVLRAFYLGQTPFLPGISELLLLEVQLPFPYETVYQNDFENLVGNEWCQPELTTAPMGQKFLGEFSNTINCLFLDDLPPHNWVQVSFDLYIIGSWDGNQVEFESPQGFKFIQNMDQANKLVGPDIWSARLPAENPYILMHTTFSNWSDLGFRQAFPGLYKLGDFSAQTGASAVNMLGYKFGDVEMDSIYHFTYTFPHKGDIFEIEYSAQGLQSADDESWGLDNMVVRVNNMPLHQIFLPASHHSVPASER